MYLRESITFLVQLLGPLHRGGESQIGEVICGGSPYLCCKGDEIKMYIDRRVTPPYRVTSLSWGPPPPCKQALTYRLPRSARIVGKRQKHNHKERLNVISFPFFSMQPRSQGYLSCFFLEARQKTLGTKLPSHDPLRSDYLKISQEAPGCEAEMWLQHQFRSIYMV